MGSKARPKERALTLRLVTVRQSISLSLCIPPGWPPQTAYRVAYVIALWLGLDSTNHVIEKYQVRYVVVY